MALIGRVSNTKGNKAKDDGDDGDDRDDTKSNEENENGNITNNTKEASKAMVWEDSILRFHYHPSVAKFASTVGDIGYNGDPLKDFALAPFLDKFSYRNPKSKKKLKQHLKRGESVAERRSGLVLRQDVPVNDPRFLRKTGVKAEDEFYQKFFTEQARREELKDSKDEDPDTEDPDGDASDPEKNDDDDNDNAFETVSTAEVEKKVRSLELTVYCMCSVSHKKLSLSSCSHTWFHLVMSRNPIPSHPSLFVLDILLFVQIYSWKKVGILTPKRKTLSIDWQ